MAEPHWYLTKDGDVTCLELYERHYSCYDYKDGRERYLFAGPGEEIVLRTGDGDAMFVWRKFIDASGQQGINCAVFRNEGPLRSSLLIEQADAVADHCWPGERHYTYVDPKAVRSSNPGFCFVAAGWRKCGVTKGGLLIFERLASQVSAPQNPETRRVPEPMSSHRKPDAATLAKYFPSVTTADKIPPPPPRPIRELPDSRPDSAKAEETPVDAQWSREKRHAFSLMAPHALYVAATDGPVSITLYHPNGEVKKRFGHNRGCWPVRISSTSSWKDEISRSIDKDPFLSIRVKKRVWVPTFTEASRLVMEVGGVLAAAAERAGFEPLLHGFIDAGPNFSKVDFERDILLLARSMSIVAWTELALSEFLDRALSHAELKGIAIMDDRGRKIESEAFQRHVDKLAMKEAEKQFPGRR